MQGSILGDLLFVIYINDIPSIFSFLLAFLVADAIKFLGHITSPLDWKLVQKDLDHLATWSCISRFDFNLTKTFSSLSSKTNVSQLSQTISLLVSLYRRGRIVQTLVLCFLPTSLGPCITKRSPPKCTKYLAYCLDPLSLGYLSSVKEALCVPSSPSLNILFSSVAIFSCQGHNYSRENPT